MDDERKQLTEHGLTLAEDEKCKIAFDIFDKDGSGHIDAAELKRVLEMMGQQQSEETIYHMVGQACTTKDKRITLDAFKQVIGEQKKVQNLSQAEDTLDAFVSLGGEQDGSGHINAQVLIDIVKKDFEMTIDIEKLIQEIDEDNSGQIEYEEFMELLCSKAET